MLAAKLQRREFLAQLDEQEDWETEFPDKPYLGESPCRASDRESADLKRWRRQRARNLRKWLDQQGKSLIWRDGRIEFAESLEDLAAPK